MKPAAQAKSRQAHNLKVVGSNPAPATIKKACLYDGLFFVFEIYGQIFVWGCLFSCEQRVCGEMPELELFEQSKN